MAEKHTPTPWFEDAGFIAHVAPNGVNSPLFELAPVLGTDDEIRADIDFLFRAVNAHDALVTALRLAHEEIHHPGSARHEGKDIVAIIERALALATPSARCPSAVRAGEKVEE